MLLFLGVCESAPDAAFSNVRRYGCLRGPLEIRRDTVPECGLEAWVVCMKVSRKHGLLNLE